MDFAVLFTRLGYRKTTNPFAEDGRSRTMFKCFIFKVLFVVINSIMLRHTPTISSQIVKSATDTSKTHYYHKHQHNTQETNL